MISYINGTLTHKDPTFIIIDAGGIGYSIKISLNTYSMLAKKEEGDTCKLFTYLHIKEDAHTLYGFADPQEKVIFLALISISGVGPGTALMILSSLSTDETRQAIIDSDVHTIQSVKGIGTKTAQRIILELKDKILALGPNESTDRISTTDTAIKSVSKRNTLRNEALSALITLGIAKAVAEKNVDTVLKLTDEEITLEELIRQALKTA